MSQKRITLICSSFPPEKGAAPGRMFRLAELLSQNGYTVSVLCAMPNYPTGKIFEGYKWKLVSRENLEGIQVTRSWLIPTHSSRRLKRAVSQLSYVASLLLLTGRQLVNTRPETVIVSSPPFVTGYLGCLLAKKLTRAKIILNISDLWPGTAYELGFLKDGPLYRFLLRREQNMYRLADAFTVQSEEIGRHIQRSLPDAALFLYRNLQAPAAQATQSRPAGKRKIVYAGLLGIAQGVLDIVKAVDFAAWDTELHIYGQGNELQGIQDWISAHPGRCVVYKGSVAAKEIPAVLTQYHAMLIPLTQHLEGAVPSKIFNALANGLPILFSGDGEGAAIVRQTGTGLTNRAGDFAGLEKNVAILAGLTAEQYEQMRQQCIICSQETFNKDIQDESFIQFLSTISGKAETEMEF
ncbi:MAG TPA: glycosyltransferase family 4 protein [Chitinophagaceae bacterium]|nr:glycosyltransferase family 4 protein [Chitinophagaceae bacterium]